MRKFFGLLDILLSNYRQASIAIAALAVAALPGGAAWAQSPDPTPVNLLATVPIPVAPTNKTGGLYAYDISFVDQTTQTYYLGDRSNSAVDVVDAATGSFVKQITATPPFAGVAASCPDGDVNDCSGPNGVVTGGNCLFVGDSPSRVRSFMLPEGKEVSILNTGGPPFRADEMSYDSKDRILVAANNANVPPFVSVINVSSSCKLTLKEKIVYNLASGVNATNGAEQSLWDPATGLFYHSIPQTGDKSLSPNGPNGLVIAIDPTSGKIVDKYPVYLCQPAGLALNPTNDTLLLGCSVVFDTAGVAWSSTDSKTATPYQVVMRATDGAIAAYVPGVGGSDEVSYNSGDNRWYTASSSNALGPALGIIDGKSFALDQTVQTINVAAVTTGTGKHPAGQTHSVAANGANGWVFVPHPANNILPGCLTGCIGIYAQGNY
jgi:hypothetical protein